MRSTEKNSGPARVLLLQGPVGPFFQELAQALVADGVEVTQLTFNQGDVHFSDSSLAVPVACRLEDFSETLALHLKTGIDVVVFFGSERPAHKIARHLCKQMGVPALSFEEGYVRPGAITLEREGNNASSPLSRLNVAGLGLGRKTRMEAANYRGYWPMVWHGWRYYFLRQVFGNERERSFHHRDTPIGPEMFFWLRNVLRKMMEGGRHKALSRLLVREFSGDYYVVPLQVPSDSNIKQASNGWTTHRLIHEVIASFARSAPKSARLVFKIHPMARGHSSDHKLIWKLAETYRVRSRVYVLHTGMLGELTRESAGMITINSTSGLSALHHGVPLLTVGKSIYAHPELATLARGADDIDQFWASNHVAPRELRRAFLAQVRSQALMPGDFYARRGRLRAVKSARKRILQTISQHRAAQK